MKSKIEIYNSSNTLKKTLVGDELYNAVSYYKNINASTDLQLGQVASAQVTFTTIYSSVTKSDWFKYYTWQECDSNYRLIGYYYVNNIQKEVNNYTITGYDCICKLDQDISDWLKNTCTATNITQLFAQVCSKCGLGSGTSSFLTNTYMTLDPKEIYSPGITGRAVMGFIAEATSSFVYTRDDNLVHCYTYTWASSSTTHTPTKTTLTASDYSYLNMAKEYAPQVTNIAVNSINGTYQSNPSTPSATMSLIYNPTLYNKTVNALQTPVANIKGVVAGIGTYYPCKFKCFCDYKLQCGDIIYVNDGVSNKKVLIMSIRTDQTGTEFECFGQAEREPFILQNTDRITNLESGKFNIEEWTGTSSGKVFNSTVTATDILIPNGLEYTGNVNNKSLISVIQYILQEIGRVPLNMSGSPNSGALNHTYDTGLAYSSYASGSSSSNGVSVSHPNGTWVLTCNNNTGGSPNNATVTISGTGGTKTFDVTSYTAVGTVNVPMVMWYFPDITYDNANAASKVYLNSTSGTPIYNDLNSSYVAYDENYYLWRDYENEENFTVCFKQPGLYYWQVIDRTRETVAATWKFLIQ